MTGAKDDEDDPCVGVCMIGEDGLCLGCGRTEDEIYGPAADPPPAADSQSPG